MAVSETFRVDTERPEQAIDVTSQVRDVVKRAGIESGVCQVMVLHSTAAIAVNETADPNIGADVITALGNVVPRHGEWLHDRIDDNAHAHVKASLLGPSELIPVRGGELVLGTWQGIWLFEFDGPRPRSVCVHVLAA
ncbi:MAG: secondary thiamine-phosphate synthase enzyme YjbQ [Myxococcales bacterium]|nr:secondary thiamine-phosphate synthase enzyme YjbQ [Myxococcales bacterium]MDH5305796.1 secondary thiamine-phosphate synthase enzyme YjbQ [Myxococcales bacterium]MDH5565783.1 secondary thiamine-phosphate synthase enzyme YjbQ [Myxococcales bacterium]